MAAAPDIPAIARDAEWLAHRYDPQYDAVHFVRADRDTHRAATFIIDEYLPGHTDPVVVARGDALATQPPVAPIHFIFHSAFCCSTLLARAMDAPGAAMGLKEPRILNDLQGWRARGAEPPRLAAALDAALTLLARPFAPGEAIVVKPSNIASGLYSAMLTMRPASRVLLLHAPLEHFIGSVARKGLDGRLWVRELLAALLKDGLVGLGFTSEEVFRQTDLQVAAAGWLAQHALFHRLAAKYPGRVATLDSETMLARTQDTLARLAALFDLDLDAAAIAAGPAFRSHSKNGAAFDAAGRRAEQISGEAAHADEIAKVTVWAEAVAKAAGVDLALPAPLLD